MPDLLDRLRTALANRYRVDREIGRGGMANVFLAHDLKLDRPVALKVLRSDVTEVLGSERFLREIRLTAKLEHPHILAIHDCGEADGLLYYVMPYVEGESLRHRLDREKQLGVEEALQFSREVADALSHAHAHGVIHRDIKPENILLQSGHAVVADFGIARAIDHAGGEKLTGTGIALGTPAYMSPEQAAGSKDLDGRSDLYALGCVLFEMLAGRPPFVGPTADNMIYQHLTAAPPSITDIRPSVPSWVTAALERSLAKTPADRFNPVAQFTEAIAPRVTGAEAPASQAGPERATTKRRRRWLIGAVAAVGTVTAGLVLLWPRTPGAERGANGSPAQRPWVIVASFDGTADPSYRRTARDLARAVLDQSTVMATLPDDQIRRALELAGEPETTAVTEAMARELAVRGGIGTVVTGQVDRVGSSYSVLLRLVRAKSGEVLAAQPGTARDDDALIPTIESAVRTLRTALGEQRASLELSAPMPEVMTPSFAAYQKYADAERLWFAEGKRNEANALLREALVLDPGFASAWLMLGLDPVTPEMWADLDSARQRAKRLTPAERARLEWTDSYYRWHLSAARGFAEQWRRERPNDWQARNVVGLTLLRLGDPDAMLEVLDSAAGLDPYKADLAANNRTLALILVGRRTEARQAATGIVHALRRNTALLVVAELDAAWREVDSLVPLWERASVAAGNRATHPTAHASLHLVRGEVRAAEAARAGVRGSRFTLLWELATSSPITRADSSWEGAFEAALANDTAAARAALPGLTADSLDYRTQSGYWPAAIEAAVAYRRGDWRAVVQHTGPLLRDRSALGDIIGPGVRWLTAHAYEQLDRRDSAAALLGQLVEPGRLDGPSSFSFPYGAAHSYLQQHLIVLLAGMGRLEEARRHWEVFRTTFTNPDPAYAHLLEDARKAMDEAERKRKRE